MSVYRIMGPLVFEFVKKLEESRHEKGVFLHMRKQGRSNRLADRRLFFRNKVRPIHLLSKFEISSLFPSSMAEQPGLCWTWSETPKTGFLMTRLNYGKLEFTGVHSFSSFFSTIDCG